MKNFDYSQLDPDIRETVKYIHSLGYETTDSGDGHSKLIKAREIGEPFLDPNEVLDYAHVVIQYDNDYNDIRHEADELYKLIKPQIIDADKESLDIQVSYSVKDNITLIMIDNIDDDSWVKNPNE